MGAAMRPAPIDAPAGGSWAPTGSPAGGEGITIPEKLVNIERVGDQIDIYQLAYQVADIIRRRGR
jgi:hypothetical protein